MVLSVIQGHVAERLPTANYKFMKYGRRRPGISLERNPPTGSVPIEGIFQCLPSVHIKWACNEKRENSEQL